MARMLSQAGVSPNLVSAASMVCAVAGGILFVATAPAHDDHPAAARLLFLAGAGLVLLRGLCNVLDGMVAIARGVASPVGELWNEVPDRVSDCAMLIGLGYAVGGSPTLGWLAALLAVLTAYVRAQCRAAGAPQDFGGPMAKPTRLGLVAACGGAMALLPWSWTLGWWGAATAGLSGPARGVPDSAAAGLPAAMLLLIAMGSLLTAWRRLARAARQLAGRPPVPGNRA